MFPKSREFCFAEWNAVTRMMENQGTSRSHWFWRWNQVMRRWRWFWEDGPEQHPAEKVLVLSSGSSRRVSSVLARGVHGDERWFWGGGRRALVLSECPSWIFIRRRTAHFRYWTGEIGWTGRRLGMGHLSPRVHGGWRGNILMSVPLPALRLCLFRRRLLGGRM